MVAMTEIRPRARTNRVPARPGGAPKTAIQRTIFVLALVFFLIPPLAAAVFGFTLPGQGFTLEPLTDALAGTDFLAQLSLTLQLAALSTLGSLVLLVPTLLWLHLRAPKMLRFTEWLSVVPYVVPAIALVGGASLFFRNVFPGFLVSSYSLVPFYMVMTLPLVYRTLDAGIRALDIRTLTAASAALGANGVQTFRHVLLPNLGSALMGSSLLSVAMVLGEYALASLLLHSTFPVFMVQVGMNQPRAAAALSFITILATWLLLAALSGVFAKRTKSTTKNIQKGGAL